MSHPGSTDISYIYSILSHHTGVKLFLKNLPIFFYLYNISRSRSG